MGVEYYGCKKCGDSLYEEYVDSCNKCNSRLCTNCLVNDDVKSRYAHRYGYKFDSGNPELMNRYEEEGFCLYDSDGKPHYSDGDIIDDSGIDNKYCPYCSGDSINRESVLDYLVSDYGFSIEELWEEMKRNNPKTGQCP